MTCLYSIVTNQQTIIPTGMRGRSRRWSGIRWKSPSIHSFNQIHSVIPPVDRVRVVDRIQSKWEQTSSCCRRNECEEDEVPPPICLEYVRLVINEICSQSPCIAIHPSMFYRLSWLSNQLTIVCNLTHSDSHSLVMSPPLFKRMQWSPWQDGTINKSDPTAGGDRRKINFA